MKQTCPELLQLPLGLWFEVRCSFSCLTCLCFVQATIHWPNCSIYRRACLRYPKTPVQIVQILFLADILGVFDLNWRRMQTVTQATFHKWICRTPLCATQPRSIHRKLMIFIQQKFDFNRIKHRFGFQPLRWGFKKKNEGIGMSPSLDFPGFETPYFLFRGNGEESPKIDVFYCPGILPIWLQGMDAQK